MYKCVNKDCNNYNKEVKPGGTVRVINGSVSYTGSICKICGKEMKMIPKAPEGFGGIINPGDGRNL